MLRGNSLDPFFRIMWTNERRVGETCTWQAATGWSGAIRMVCRMCSTSFFGFHSASHSTIQKPCSRWHAAIAKVLHFRITCAQPLGVPRGVCIMRSWLAGIAPAMTRYGVGSPGSGCVLKVMRGGAGMRTSFPAEHIRWRFAHWDAEPCIPILLWPMLALEGRLF